MRKLNIVLLCMLISAGFVVVPAGAVRPKLPESKPIVFKPPQGTRVELKNGLVLYLLEDRSLPIIKAGAYIKTGAMYDPMEKIGLAELAGMSLRTGGSAKYKADDINSTLEYLGASIESSISFENGQASMFCLSKDFDKVFDIFTDILRNPAFEEEKVKVNRDQMLEIIKRRNDEPQEISNRESLRMLYGPGHPYGWRKETATVENISREDLLAFHKRFVKPNAMILYLAGDFSEKEMIDKVRAGLEDWPKTDLDLPVIPPVAEKQERRVYEVNKEVSQTSVNIVQLGIKRHDPDDFNLQVANEVLGGNSLSSRLGAEVRSRRGLAYYVYCYFAKRTDYGFFNASVGTKPQSTTQAIEEILLQIGKMKKEPVPQAELNAAKDGIANSYVFRFTTPYDIMDERASFEYYRYPPDYLDTYVDQIKAVSVDNVLKASDKWLKPDAAVIFAVGNEKEFDKPLSMFGPVEERPAD